MKARYLVLVEGQAEPAFFGTDSFVAKSIFKREEAKGLTVTEYVVVGQERRVLRQAQATA